MAVKCAKNLRFHRQNLKLVAKTFYLRLLVLDVQRALLDFVVDAADVFAEDADGQKLHAGEEHDGGHERCPAGNCRRGGEELLENRPDEQRKADDGRDPAHVKAELERCGAESGDAVEGEAKHLFERILGRARGAFGAVVLDADFLEADPADESAQEAAAFGEVLELVHHAAVHESEVAGVGRDVDAREPADEAVEAERGEALEERFALALVALRVNDLVAFAPLFEHLVDEARRVLQVPVDNHDGVADAVVESRAECGLVAEVAAEVDDLVVRVAGEEPFHDFAGAVLGTVVHENQFVLDVLEFFLEDTVGLGNNFFFVKNRNDYG